MPASRSDRPTCAQGHVQPEAGGHFCVECGGPVLPAPAPGAPACALHPHLGAAQACARCGSFACQICLRAAPDGIPLCVTCENRRGAQELPWDRRDRVGTLRAFVRTCWMILTHPGRTLDQAQPEGGMGSSLWFAVLAETATYLTTLLVYGAIVMAVMLSFATRGPESGKELAPLATAGVGTGILVAMGAVFLVSALGLTLLSSALDHLVLRMVGANPRSFEVTLRAHALSLAPALLGVVPFCGPYVVPVWSLVVRVFAYRGLHRIGGAKAAAGALLVPGVLALVAFAGYLAVMIVAMATGTP